METVTTHEERWSQVCEPALKRIEARLERIDDALNGNGREGLNVRVARVEQGQSRIWWIIAGAWAALLGILGVILK